LAFPAELARRPAAFDKRKTSSYLRLMTDPRLKAAALALLESGEMRVAEVADLIGHSRQLVATWCPGATLEARRRWCKKRWSAAIKGVDKAVVRRP
jgi:hypothetical protein